jgi:hypothetical protein
LKTMILNSGLRLQLIPVPKISQSTKPNLSLRRLVIRREVINWPRKNRMAQTDLAYSRAAEMVEDSNGNTSNPLHADDQAALHKMYCQHRRETDVYDDE